MPTTTPGVDCIAGRIRLQVSAENPIGTRHTAVESASDRCNGASNPGGPRRSTGGAFSGEGLPTAPRERTRARTNDPACEALENLVLHEAMMSARRVRLKATPARNGDATLRRMRKDEGARPRP
jgi:hypothetical protein